MMIFGLVRSAWGTEVPLLPDNFTEGLHAKLPFHNLTGAQ